MSVTRLELALGPLFFHWPESRIADFYAAIADEAPVDRVYIGEVVCGKRASLVDRVLARSAERLAAAGKTVVWSCLSLPANKRDRMATAELSAWAPGPIEINDLGALPHRHGAPFVGGPFLNIYNEVAARELVSRGCVRLCPPVEISLADVGTIASGAPSLEIELFAFGRAPLALSGRCYHAREAGTHRDACRFVCDRDPDGMDVASLDGEAFLAVNGLQTLSHGLHVAAVAPDLLRRNGVSALRLSPQSVDMVAVARGFRDLLDERVTPHELIAALEGLGLPGALVSGYVTGEAGRLPPAPRPASGPPVLAPPC